MVTHIEIGVAPIVGEPVCVLSSPRVQQAGEEFIRRIIGRMRKCVIRVEREPEPWKMRKIRRHRVIFAASEWRIGCHVTAEAELRIDIGVKIVECCVCRSIRVPRYRYVRGLEKSRQWRDSAIKGANKISTKLN